MRNKILATLGFALATLATGAPNPPMYKTCAEDSSRLAKRSSELQKIVKADQDDRENWEDIFRNPRRAAKLQKRDEDRRKRIGEIFGEGCFKEAADYSAAALVYQHGNTADHLYQAFVWFKKAFELGDQTQKRMIGMALDRYLVHIGQKQLFATQASLSAPDSKCWCLEQVELTFPDSRRIENNSLSMEKALEWVKDLNKQHPECPIQQCKEKPLKDTPAGSIVGVW